MHFNLLVDTPGTDCLEVDGASQVNIHGFAINFGNAALGGTACIVACASQNVS